MTGKPLIAYTIETAFASNLFSKIMVSTDSKKIAAIAIEHGAKVPFLRPDEISGDAISSDDVILYAYQSSLCSLIV